MIFYKDFAKNQLRRFFAAVLKNHLAPKLVSVRSALLSGMLSDAVF